jgi:hypothetical protein
VLYTYLGNIVSNVLLIALATSFSKLLSLKASCATCI